MHVEDRGLQLGDSIYEVFSVLNGRIHDEEEHLDRLERSVREIQMAMPMGPRSVEGRNARNGPAQSRARRVSLPSGLARHVQARSIPIPKESQRPTLVLTARPYDVRGGGTAAIGWHSRHHPAPTSAGAAATSRRLSFWPIFLPRQRRGGRAPMRPRLVDQAGFVTEGTSTNAWIVDKDGQLITRGLSNAILPGVTRRVILEVAAEAQLPVLERQFTPDDVKVAREAFISSASGAAVPVVTIDGVQIGDGKPGLLTRRIGELYAHRSDQRAAAADRPG